MRDTPTAQRRSANVPSGGYVYFIRGGDAIKIGFSKEPPSRLPDLQVANPEKLDLIGAVRGTRKDERELHQMFCHLEIRGEWFRAELELIEYINSALADEAWENARPAPSAETLAAIKLLIQQRDVYGADTSLGIRHSTLIEQIRSMQDYERPAWATDIRQTSHWMIDKQLKSIEQLKAKLN
jgi:hypothetical protein